MGIIYDPVSNALTITGYSESVPCNFDDLYNADKTGSLQLLSPKVVAPSTEVLRPNAAGDYQEWETLVDTSHEGATSDQNDATYIQTVGSSSKRDVQHLEDPTLGTVASIEVKIRAYAIGSGAPERLYIMDKVGANERLTSVGTITRGLWNEYSTGTLTTNPAGDPWTVVDVQNLQAGVQVQTLGSGDTLRVSEIWVIITASAYQTSLDRPVQPADSGALKLTLIITNFSQSGTITLTGKDAMDDAQTEDISITGNGNYVTQKSWSNIDANGISCTGNYTLEITQPRWGIISKEFDYAFGVDAKLYVGDGGTETWFAEEGKQIIFGSAVNYIFYIEYNAHLRLGHKVSETLKLGDRGCHIITTRSPGSAYIWTDAGCYVEFYATVFTAKSGSRLLIRINADDLKMWMCGLDLAEIILNPLGTYFHDIYRLTGLGGNIGLTPVLNIAKSSLTDFFLHSYNYALYTQLNLTTKVKNVVLKNNTYILYASAFDGNFYLINAEADNWAINWLGVCNGKLYRQYEFDVHCQDKNGDSLSGVSVVGEYISPYGQAFSETTDVNGNIPTQTVDRSWHEQATGNTENLKTPLKVTYKKTGYQTVVKYYSMDKKTEDTVVMHKAVSVFLDFGRPVINLKKTDPENKNVIVVG